MALDGDNVCSRAAARRLLVMCAFFVVWAWSAGAFAQDELSLDVQTFRPAAGPYSIFTVEGSETLGHLEPTGSVILDYASESLVLEPAGGGEDVAVVDQQLAMHVLAGVGFFDLAQLDLEIPVYFVNESDLDDTDIEGGVIGDMAIRSKVTILSRKKYPVGLAGGLDLTLPTGREEALVGDASAEVAPRAIVDYQYDNILFAANLGVRVQEDTTIRNIDIGERLEYGAGAEVSFLKGLLRLSGELYGRTELSDPFGSGDESPLEALLGAKIATRSGFSVMAGAGGGLVGGVGAPEFRTFVGLRYAYMETDTDKDGVFDFEDRCPREAEDIDGFEDADGCADEDNDGDGVPDIEDRCAQTAGPAENDGCPVEGAGEEEAPEERERIEPEELQPDQGEPGEDQMDGAEQTRPTEPPKDQGPDADADGTADANDLCPEMPEDEDGFEDADGCPDPDNDKDGIVDTDDNCPNEPGLQTNKGCPAKEQKATLENGKIVLANNVGFESDKALIEQSSYELLQQVGLILRTHPEIRKVEIAAYTATAGKPEAYNKRLSQARAEAVRDFLVEGANISEDRLVAKGHGAGADKSPVEFRIVEHDDADAE